MPPKKKNKNLSIAKQSDNIKNSEWIPGSEMVFETPDTNLVSRSQRFTRSLQSFENVDLAQIPSVLSQSFISTPGVTTRLRRQSLIVGKIISNVSSSTVNCSLSESVSKVNSTHQTSKRLSSSKLVTVSKSSESVSKMSSSKVSTPPITRTRKKSEKDSEMEIVRKKSEKSFKDEDEDKDEDNTDNLLDVDEINAIINDLQDNSKRKSHVSNVDSEKKTKFIKISNKHPETSPRRSPRIAKMRKAEAEDKTLNMSFQSLPNKRHRKRKAKTNTEEETAAKNPVVVSEEFRDEIIEVPPEKADKVQKKTPKRKSSRQNAKREEDVLEINAKYEKESPATSNNNVEEENLVVKSTPQNVTNKISEVEKEAEVKTVCEKIKESEKVAVTKTNEDQLVMSEEKQIEIGSLEDENIKENADKLVEPKQKSDSKEEEEKSKEILSDDQEKAIIDETIPRRVTRQMASSEGKEDDKNVISQQDDVLAEEKLLQVEKDSSPQMKVFPEPKDTYHLSSKSTKTKKSITYRKSGNTICSLHRFTPAKTAKKKISSEKAASKVSKISQRKLTPLRGVSSKKINQKKIVTGEDETMPSKKKKTTVKADIEKKPQQSVVDDDDDDITEKQKATEENVELITSLEEKTIQSKEGEESELANQKVLVTTEMSTNGVKRKLTAEKCGVFSSPLLSSTPDIAKKAKIDVKTSFASKLHKTVSNLSPFSVRSFEYSRTSVVSANNQTIEESVLLQKVQHNKVNNESNENKIETEKDEIKMKVDADSVSMEIEKKAQKADEEMSPIEKNVHYESQSGVEVAALDITEVEDESHLSEKEDLCAVTKSIHYESQQSETEDETHMSQDDQDENVEDVVEETKDVLLVIDPEKDNMICEEGMSPIEKNVHYESQSGVEVAALDITEVEDESHLSEKEDLCAVTKSIHYESQQSETEDETHMSQDDQDENVEDVVEETKDVLLVIDPEKDNMICEEGMSPIEKNVHYESQSGVEVAALDITEVEDESHLSEKEDVCAVTKSIHYESQQSETEDETHMSLDDQDENVEDVVEETKDVLLVIDPEKDNMICEEGMSPIEKNVHYESQSGVEVAALDITEVEDESHLSEKEDLCAVTKSIHYESQQSETEDETHMSQDDQDENVEDVVEETKDVLLVIDPEKEYMQQDEIRFHDGSYQSQIEEHNLDIVVKKLHYESEQSMMSVSDVKDFEISMEEEKEKPDENSDIDVDYNASYSNYGLRCIIL